MSYNIIYNYTMNKSMWMEFWKTKKHFENKSKISVQLNYLEEDTNSLKNTQFFGILFREILPNNSSFQYLTKSSTYRGRAQYEIDSCTGPSEVGLINWSVCPMNFVFAPFSSSRVVWCWVSAEKYGRTTPHSHSHSYSPNLLLPM